MTGIIVMGHGNFASGMTTTLNLLGGEQKAYAAIDFVEGEAFDKLQDNLYKAANALKECEHIVILCDINGGSPYKAALLYSLDKVYVDIIAGFNFPFLLELCLGRSYTADINLFLDETIQKAKSNFERFDKNKLL